ncbi:hypothetical protein AB6A40_009064 [Gnathostoma spinigerum]|uniref:Ig-like domain-containing protein n=1 Tax=Gnathostoma spinigerum TaxID=75299 RepID=A0ABD6EQV6_9BILA
MREVLRYYFLLLLLIPSFARRPRTRYLRQDNYQVIDSPYPQDVDITVYPVTQDVREGRDATIDCHARTADNSAYPEVRWSRAGAPLPASAYISGGRLTLNQLSLSDSGDYICTTTHNGRSYEARAKVNVQTCKSIVCDDDLVEMF